MSRWSSPVAAVLAVVVLVGAAVGADLAVLPNTPAAPDPVTAGPAVAGAWYCTAGDTTDERTLRVTAAVPPTAGLPAEVETAALRDGTVEQLGLDQVFPETARSIDVASGESGTGFAVRWWERPAAVGRTWSVGGAGLPTGLVSGPCAFGPSTTWYVPGMSTAGGAEARLYLGNPFTNDASVAIRFTTPDGEVAPIALENIVVEGQDVTVVTLNDHVPRQRDFGVVVEARSGRVVTEGVQFVSAAIGGVDGVSLVRATSRLATTWTVPWSLNDPAGGAPVDVEVPPAGEPTPDPTENATGEPGATEVPQGPDEPEEPGELEAIGDGGTASWVWITNPGDEIASVTLTLMGTDGPVVPDLGGELTVDPQSVLRVDLQGLLPEGQSSAGATVRSENDVPVAVSVGTIVGQGGAVERTGYAAQLGATEPDVQWILPGEETTGRQQFLHLVNPGGEAAVVDVSLWTGASVLRPDELAGITVPAGALVQVDLTELLPDTSYHTVFVNADQGAVVAGRRGVAPEGRAALVVTGGIPAGAWRGGEAVPPVSYRPELIEQLDTSLGLTTTEGPLSEITEIPVTPTVDASPVPLPVDPSLLPTPDGG